MKIKLLLFSLIISTLGFSQGRVDGFYKGKGNLDLVLGGGAEINSKFYAGNDLIDLSRTIINVNFFAAYGITDQLDVNVSAPFVSTEGGSNLQDGAVYLKYKLLERGVYSGKLSFTLAAGYSTNLTDYETEGITAIGQQATVYDIRPVLHYFSGSGVFATGQFSFQTKSSPTPDAMGATLKIGKASEKFYYDFWYEFQESDGGANYLRKPFPRETLMELGADYHRVGGTFYKPIKEKLGYFVGLVYTLDGRNVGQGFGINGGIVLKR